MPKDKRIPSWEAEFQIGNIRFFFIYGIHDKVGWVCIPRLGTSIDLSRYGEELTANELLIYSMLLRGMDMAPEEATVFDNEIWTAAQEIARTVTDRLVEDVR